MLVVMSLRQLLFFIKVWRTNYVNYGGVNGEDNNEEYLLGFMDHGSWMGS